MIGFMYLGWAIVSHLGYVTKKFIHDVNAPVNKRTGTYIGYDGREYLAGTNKHVYWTHSSSGDEVLLDRPGHVLRNISEEQREKEFKALKENRNGASAYKTNQVKRIAYRNPVMNCIEKQHAMIYWDLDNGSEYVCVDCYVSKEDKYKEFYAKLFNPYEIVRISDQQREYELLRKKRLKPNWIDNPEEEREFIIKHNNGPYPPAGIITLKRG